MTKLSQDFLALPRLLYDIFTTYAALQIFASTPHTLECSPISFEEYLERVEQSVQGFEEIQESLLMEKSHYSKTRYGVLTLSFKKILEVNPAFKELLFLVCLLDSQHIPRKLLELFKQGTVVDDFLHYLRKYSLFTGESSLHPSNGDAWFSLHRSTQCAGYSFMSLLLTTTEKQAFSGKLIDVLKAYYDASAKKGSAGARTLIPHLEKLLKTLKYLNLPSKYILEIEALLGKALIYGHSNYLLGKTYLLEVAHQPCLSDLTMAKVYQDLGEISMMEQDFKQGIFYTNKSSLLYKKDPSGEPEVLENLITLLHAYTYLDDVEKAKGYAQEAFQKLKDLKANERTKKEFEARVYSRLVTVYNYQYLHGPHGEEAEKYALKALSILGAEEFFFKTQAKPTKLLSSQVIMILL